MTKDLVYSLAELKTMITENHAGIMDDMQNAIKRAIRVGECLVMAKEAVGHGNFEDWVTENFIFTPRSAQRYIKVFQNKDAVLSQGVTNMTEAIAMISPPKEKKEKMKEVQEQDDWQEEEHIDAEYEEIEDEHPEYRYWEILGPLVRQMITTHEKLKKTRNHTTPIDFGFLIGNIMQMAIRLDSWNPKFLNDCKECGGDGVVTAKDQDNGTIITIRCKNCFSGKAGLASPTEL